MDGDADAVALSAPDAHGLIHIDAVDILDDTVGAFEHPHQHGLTAVDDAGLPEAGFVIEVQALFVLRRSGQEETVGAVFLEVLNDLLQGGLAVTLALFAFVDHEAPEPVTVVFILFFRIECEHAEADQSVVRVDRERTRSAGVLLIRFFRFFQRIAVRRDEGLILTHSERKNGLAIVIIYSFQFDYHNWFSP